MSERDGRITIDIEGDDSDFRRSLDKTGESAGKLGGILSDAGSKLGSALEAAAEIGVSAIRSAGNAAVELAKQATDAYADYEQLAGGVETLFGGAMGTVMSNAKQAFETAGMSANEYMETATSSAAAMVASLGGDQVKAAELTDVAIRDMSDNANKMGTSLESIKNAYAGFAKQNYTMLDNLKLGYGGTQAEMQRLLEDAQKISGIEYNMANYADVVSAIHVIQTNMRISGLSAEEAAEMVDKGLMTQEEALEAMGTTAKEASSTISGSLGMAKAAWQNVLVGVADDTQDLNGLIDTFVDSAVKAVKNLLPRFGQAINGVGKLVQGFSKVLPEVAGEIVGAIPSLLDAAVSAGEALLTGISSALPQLVPTLAQTISSLAQSLMSAAPKIGQAFKQTLDTVMSEIVGNSGNIQSFFENIISGISSWTADLDKAYVNILDGINTALESIDLAGFAESIGEIIQSRINSLTANLPSLLNAVSGILANISKVLLSPETIQAAVKSATNIVKALVSSFKVLLPMVIEGISSMLSGIVAALSDGNILSTIIDGISGIIQAIAGILTDGSTLPRLIGAAVQIMTQLCAALANSATILVDAAIQIIDGFLDFLLADDNLTKLIEGAFAIISAIAEGLITNIETLITAAVEIIGKLVEYFTDPENLGRLTDAALAIITAIGNGIISLAGTLWSAAGEIVNKIVEYFANPENIASLKESGKAILGRIGEGLLTVGDRLHEWFSSILETMRTKMDEIDWHELGVKIITNILDFGKSAVGKLADFAVWWWDFFESLGAKLADVDWGELGHNILDGIMQGMLDLANGGSWLWSKISALGSGIVDGFKAYFGIASPSKLMADQIGQYIPQGIAVGIDADTSVIDKQLQSSLRSLDLTGIQTNGFHLPPIDLTRLQVSGAMLSSPVRESPQSAESLENTVQNGDIIIPVQIGGETLDTVIVSALQLANARSGGRTI
jgi:phage-related protein